MCRATPPISLLKFSGKEIVVIALPIILILIGVLGLIWNILKHPERRIDGSSISLLFCSLVGVALLLEPESINLPFVNYKKQAKKELAEIAQIKNASKEMLAIQIWNQGRLLDESSLERKNEQSIQIFKELYGDNFKSAIKELENKNVLLIDKEERRELKLDQVKPLDIPLYSEEQGMYGMGNK